MSVTHTLNLNFVGPGNSRINSSVEKTGGSEINRSQSIAAAGTNVAVPFVCPTAAIVSFYMVSDQALTIKTNSTGASILTLTLEAGVPYIWHDTDARANPFSADITTFYATNAGADAAQLEIRALRS